jgi:3-hydroxybutyryl-CoA dehydrogenase
MGNIEVFGVLGAGQMGSGIAQVAASSGWKVRLADVSVEVAQRAKDNIAAILGKQVEKGKVTVAEVDALIERITPAGSIEDLAPCDLVVEAVTEHVETKIKLFQALDRALKPSALLSSNTSSISITKLAGCTSRPEQVVGLHFMNPVPLMKLVEVIRALQTSDATFQAALDVAAHMNKTSITSKDLPGFIVNRMLIPFINEACMALESGLGTAEDIDTAARLGLNHPMGPLALADLIGLDTVLYISEVLQREFGDDKYRPATILRNYVAAGWYGRKTGHGFYRYER